MGTNTNFTKTLGPKSAMFILSLYDDGKTIFTLDEASKYLKLEGHKLQKFLNPLIKKGILNNTHILLFDLHGEYAKAFPKSKKLNVSNLVLPYWLMNSEELEEMFIESRESNSHNQVSQFKTAVTLNKKTAVDKR